MEKKYLSEMALAEEFLKSAKYSLDFSMRTSANRLYFALEKAVVSYVLFKGNEVSKNQKNLEFGFLDDRSVEHTLNGVVCVKHCRHHQKIWELSSNLLGRSIILF